MKTTFLILLLCSLVLLAGCWDQAEIDELAFAMGVALDPQDNDQEKEGREKEHEDDHQQKFQVTYQIAVPGALAQETEGGGGGGEPFLTMTTTGMTNFKTFRNMAAKNSRSINSTHLKVLIINQELARQGILEHLLDVYIRDHEMRRRVRVFVSEGEAKTLLAEKLPLEDLPAEFIDMVSENYHRVLQMKKFREIGELSEKAIGKKSYLIPRIVTHGKGDIKVAGAAIFMGIDNRMIGWLGEEDIAGYNWVVGEAENSILEVKDDDEGSFVFELDEMASSVAYERKQEQDVFDVEIRAEGYFVENWLPHVNLDDQEFIRHLEEEIAKEIEKQANHIINKMQNEFHADIFDFKDEVKKKEYDYWKKTREEWDGEGGLFSKAEVNVTAKVEIRHYMLNESLKPENE